MGQDKKQLTKLLDFVKEIYDHPDNKEFAAGIQSIVLNDIQKEERSKWSKQIAEIYELCLMKNLSDQAEDLYKDFPLTGIADQLVAYYMEMENARRRNDFDSFGLNLFLQIEVIVETLIREPEVVKTYEGIRNLPPILQYDSASKGMVRVADFKRDTIDKYLILKAANFGKPLLELPALDKARIIIYMVCFLAKVEKFKDATYKESIDALSGIYNVRCHDSHSGMNVSEKQEQYYEAIIADKTMNYLRFLGFLFSFIKGVSFNYPLPSSLLELAENA